VPVKGLISSTNFGPAKRCWNTAFDEKLSAQFHQWLKLKVRISAKFAKLVCWMLNTICHKKHQTLKRKIIG
jgi:hypothetical protein